MKNNEKDILIKLFAGFSIYQFLLHLFFLTASKDPRLLMPTTISFVHDLLLLSLFYFFAFWASYFLPITKRGVGEKVFISGFIVLGCFLSVYPKLLREYLIFPVNIFESDISTSKTLIFEYLGLSSFTPLFLALILGLSLIFIKKEIKISNKLKITGFIVILILSAFSLKNSSPNPLVYSFQAQIERFVKNEKRTVPSLSLHNKSNIENIVPLSYPKGEIKNYDNVLMIILEGVASKDFESGFMNIKDGFFNSNKNKAVYYNNYYANNLDSYTSLIAMITNIQVPYRSYSDTDLFDKVNYASNLADFFNGKNFESSFVSTFEYQPFIPSEKSWNNIFIRKDLPGIEKWTSIGSSRMEMAAEDKAAIDKMVSEIKENNKNFVLHELAYGHSPEWMAASGKNQLSYYNEYLTELSNKLKNNNLLNKTLFVIVSDHGDRSKAADIDNYRVPLLLVGKNIENNTNNQFLSHLDLPEIIYFYLGIGNHPIDSDKVFLVGSSEKWIYGAITRNKEYVFIDNSKGVAVSKSNNINPSEINTAFQKYINGFNDKYGKN